MQSVSGKAIHLMLQHHRCRVAVGTVSRGDIGQTFSVDCSQIHPCLSSVCSYSLENPFGDIHIDICQNM